MGHLHSLKKLMLCPENRQQVRFQDAMVSVTQDTAQPESNSTVHFWVLSSGEWICSKLPAVVGAFYELHCIILSRACLSQFNIQQTSSFQSITMTACLTGSRVPPTLSRIPGGRPLLTSLLQAGYLPLCKIQREMWIHMSRDEKKTVRVIVGRSLPTNQICLSPLTCPACR